MVRMPIMPSARSAGSSILASCSISSPKALRSAMPSGMPRKKMPPDPREQRFYGYLNHAGYTVRVKSIKYFRDEASGELTRKANLDLELAIDLFTTSSQYDTAVLVTGDGDFERAVELLRSYGKRVIVASTQDT